MIDIKIALLKGTVSFLLAANTKPVNDLEASINGTSNLISTRGGFFKCTIL